MLFFNRLFGAYYLMTTRLRKVYRTYGKKQQATALVCMIQLSLLLLSIKVFRGVFHISMRLSGILIVALGCGTLLFTFIYYLARRQRRDRVLDEFRALSVNRKRVWMYIGVLALALPLTALFLLLKWADAHQGESWSSIFGQGR